MKVFGKTLGKLLFTLVGATEIAHADNVYASYGGSQLGVTIRNLSVLNEIKYFDTYIRASGISVHPVSSDIYLAAENTLIKYSSDRARKTTMTNADNKITYTDVDVNGPYVFASYTGSHKGFTIRNSTDLQELRYCSTGVNAEGIAVDNHRQVYLAAAHQLLKYDFDCNLITTMTSPDPKITYTDVDVNGPYVYASYTGSHKGFTIRNSTDLVEIEYCSTDINAEGIDVTYQKRVYLAAANQLLKYGPNCKLLITRTSPDSAIRYTGISVW